MARVAEMMNSPALIGMDPGARWTGLAMLWPRTERTMWLEAAVLDAQTFGLYGGTAMVCKAAGSPFNTIVAVEDYRVRPVGHQSFSKAETARVIGATEFTCLRRGLSFHLVPPTAPDEELKLLGLTAVLAPWFRTWPRAKEWDHARSAIRVMAHFLLTEFPGQLDRIRASRVVEETKGAARSSRAWLGEPGTGSLTASGLEHGTGALVAPPVVLGVVKPSKTT